MSKKKRVGMDGGHAGFNVTKGKRTPDGEYEWDFNNPVVLAAIKKLEAHNVEVVRTDDPTGRRDVPLLERTNKAIAQKVDLLVSVHHNANTGVWGTWTGTETYTYLGSTPQSERLAKEVHTRLVKAYGLRDRGLKKANFHMTRELVKAGIPSILVEGGYMDSSIDIHKLRDKKVLQAAGEAIADGVLSYLGIPIKETKKEEQKVDNEKLNLVEWQKKELIDLYREAGRRGIFTSSEEWVKKVEENKLTKDEAIFLNAVLIKRGY